MTAIDAKAQIDVVWQDQQATVRIPLDGHITGDWARRYGALARRQNFAASAEDHPSRGWISVELPEGSGAKDVAQTLDTARELVKAADEAGEGADAQEVDRAIREWWAGQAG
jgi:hypothetical protein